MLKKVCKRIFWWLAFVGTLGYTFFFALPSFFFESKTIKSEPVVLSVWHVDTFEGGKGSRASFLKKIAMLYEKTEKNVTILVTSMTKLGVQTAFEEGRSPDMLSFGPGVAVNGEETYCWCEGRYALYSLSDGFEGLTAANTVVSSGGDNLPLVTAALAGMQGDLKTEVSTTAYVQFLNKKYTYLLGTQRDACRFETRGVQVYVKPLDGFCDLRQYITVVNGKNNVFSKAFIGYLLREESQKLLTGIGMFSAGYDIYSSDASTHDILESVTPSYTLSPFLSERAKEETLLAAREVMQGRALETLKKFLKGYSNTFKI